MKFKMTIDISMDNAAFEEDYDLVEKLILKIVDLNVFPDPRFSPEFDEKPIRDPNGNRVGYVTMEVTK